MKPGSPLDEDVLLDTIKVLEGHQGNKSAAAKELGIDRHTLRNRLASAAKRGLLGTKPVLEGFEITRTTAEVKDGEVVREFITQTPAVGDQPFEVGAGRAIGKITSQVKNGNVEREWIRTSPEQQAILDAIQAAFKQWEGHATPYPAPAYTDDNLLSVYPIADQHNGLLAWGKETGEAYDLRIGADRLRSSMKRLVAQSPASHRALVINLGDWQHTDDQKNMTPKSGNILDVDSRYFKILTTGVQLQQDCIDMALAKHGEVTVVNVPGNHDPHASVALTVATAAFYRDEPRVKVWSDPALVWFYRFGATLIGATHGHTMKPDRMAMTMAAHCPIDWGLTQYRYFYFGHIHHETAKEVGGVRCESFQTLAAKDAYAFHGGYNSGQSLSSITIHRHDGEIGRHRVNIPPPITRAAA
jgi:Bacterial regulatory protein, Fis family